MFELKLGRTGLPEEGISEWNGRAQAYLSVAYKTYLVNSLCELLESIRTPAQAQRESRHVHFPGDGGAVMAGRDGVQGSDARAFAERIAGYYNRCRCVNEP